MNLCLARLGATLLLCGCAAAPFEPAAPGREPDQTGDIDPLLSRSRLSYAVVAETFLTRATPDDNIDSVAAWTTPDHATWLLATAKQGDRLLIHDGDSGATLRTFGTRGDGAGEFRQPNGIAVHGDLAFVVERDNHRVQVLGLPSLQTLAMFGGDELRQPYGLWVREIAPGALEVLVTDSYMRGKDESGEIIIPPLAELDRRVQRYRLEVSGERVVARHTGAFGATDAAGAIRIPESLWGDPVHDRLLIAEEDTATGTALRVYDLDGRYRETIGLDDFEAQAEGIALWACADGSGYWLATDQFRDRSAFHVYDRASLAHLGAFAGETVANTDGVWLNQSPTTAFPAGVFYAAHDDRAVGAFDWRDVARALGLREHCAAEADAEP